MGLVQKKDEKQELDDIEVIGRGEGGGNDGDTVELVAGESAENIAAGTTAAEEEAKAEAQMIADAADEELMEGIKDDEPEDEPEPEPEDDAEVRELDAKPAAAKAEAEEEPEPEPKPEPEPEAEAEPAAPKEAGSRNLIVVAVVVAVVAVVVGYLIGHGGMGGSQGGTGSATITEDQLDTAVASWTYDGQSYSVTAQEAIEVQYSLENAADEDGNYAAPSSETIISYIRNQILLKEAEARDITVTDDEMEEYAETSIGTSDYEEMADSYGITKKQAKEIVKENCTLSKLYSQVTADVSTATMPDAPTEPEDGNTETASKEYADYIIELAGDEWDSETGTWASEDGPYYEALGSEEFTADSATYEQAETAYYVAYQEYYEASSELSSVWSDFVNELYANSSVQIWGLYV